MSESSTRVVAEITIAAPPQTVWDAVMDPHRLGEWVSIHRGLGDVSDAPLKKGSTLVQKLALRGAPFKVTWTVEQCMPNRLAVWKGKGPARSKAETVYRLADDGNGGTRFEYENDFKAPLGPLGLTASKVLVGGLPEKEAHTSLDALKALLEGAK